MAFEVIKTIKGHKYGYKVESYRENGKTKQRILEYHGRLDKPQGESAGTIANCLSIPYGLYYFGSPDNCIFCEGKEPVEAYFNIIRGFDSSIPVMTYIDAAKTERKDFPIPFAPIQYPSVVDVNEKYIAVFMDLESWINSKSNFEGKIGKQICSAIQVKRNAFFKDQKRAEQSEKKKITTKAKAQKQSIPAVCPAGKPACLKTKKCVHWGKNQCDYHLDVPDICPIGKPKCVQSHKLCDFWYAGGCNQDMDSTCESGACNMPSAPQPNTECPYCHHDLTIDFDEYDCKKMELEMCSHCGKEYLINAGRYRIETKN